MSYTFNWTHNKSTVQLPVKLGKTADDSYFSPAKMVTENGNRVEQFYRDIETGDEYKKGDLQKRYDKDHDITFNYKQMKDFLNQTVEKYVEVKGEVDATEILLNMDMVIKQYEIYNNKDLTAVATLKKVHKWLQKHNKALIVNFGYLGKERSGAIIASKNKLLLIELRDYRLIRQPKQQDLDELKSKSEKLLKRVTKNKEPEMYEKFVDALKKGKKIPKPKKAKKEEVKVASFLDD